MPANKIESEPIAVRFDHLLQVISDDRFLAREGIGNEVPFFIAPFQVTESADMERSITGLANKLQQKGIGVLSINLYDLVIEIMTDSDDWQWCLDHEQENDKTKLLETLQGVAGTEKVVEAIAQKMESSTFDVLFLHGVGEVFPYIRSHNILNSLQKEAKDQPTLMFFPGQYTHSPETGASLDLFGRLQDDKYYRAFNIYDREI